MRYLILGATEAQDDSGAALPIPGPRLRALLAALALRAGRPVPVADLVDEVWDTDPPADAPAALQALVGRLRRALGREAVRSEPGGYRLAADPDAVDLHRFTRLARDGAALLAAGQAGPAADTLRGALALWRGPALADLPGRDGHLTRPEAARAAAVRDRIEAELRSDHDPAPLVAELAELLAYRPYDEPLRAQHLRALRAAGRTADALVAYEETRRALADGLGADPGPELAALHRELLRPEPAAPPQPPKRLPPPPAGNLRPRLTSFVGREPELAALRADLRRCRLVTLTGPGGSGKTRLAEEAAHTHAHGDDGAHPGETGETAWLVELAPLDHPAAVPGAVLSALGLRENTLVAREKPSGPAASDDPTAQLVEHCARRRLLLVLDNCEHVIDAAAALAERLLVHCPGVRILATSREPLGVPGETVRPVEPLPPAPAHLLFAERATAVRPDFDPVAEHAAVAEICTRLDGLPLAIELAAARLRLLTPGQIAVRLDDRFRLLTSGSRTVLARQQTLRAVVDWSWELLDARERTLLRRLSVFAGGWDLAAAEAIAADAPALLGALVDKSLVVAVPTADGEMRFRMLETIHEYAVERAAETPEDLAATARAHRAHYLALAEEAEPVLRSAAQLPWIRRIETELDNIRAALQQAVRHDRDAAQRLVFALGWFWWVRNYRNEGADWTDRVLALGGPDDSAGPEQPGYWPRMRLHMMRIFLYAESRPMGDFRTPEFREIARRVQAAFRSNHAEAARFPGMLWPFTAYLSDGAAGFRDGLDETVTNCRRYSSEWELGVALMLRVHMDVDTAGGLAGVDADLAELDLLSHRVGDRWMQAQVLSAAAEAAMARGQYARAEQAYEEAYDLALEVGAHAERPFVMARLADIAYRRGDTPKAERILAEAGTEADRYGVSDARSFVLFLAGVIALERGDHATARRLCEETRAEAGRGTPPPQFTAALAVLDAEIAAREHGPAEALRRLAGALAEAAAENCAEQVLSAAAEAAVPLLAGTGHWPQAVRVLAAGTAWRGGHPRPVSEERRLDGAADRARERLGSEQYDRCWAAGGTLPPTAVADLLRTAAGT